MPTLQKVNRLLLAAALGSLAVYTVSTVYHKAVEYGVLPPTGKLELLDYRFADGKVTGIVQNNTGRTARHVEAHFALFDRKGEFIDMVLATREELPRGHRWGFVASVTNPKVRTAKLDVLCAAD